MKAKIAPSLMCANFLEIKDVLKKFEVNKVDLIHIDIMDGVFVPNMMLSNEIVKQFRSKTNIPYDYHLMIINPYEKLNWFDIHEGDYLSFHLEAEENIEKCLLKVKKLGAKAGLAIKPSTDFNLLKPYLKNMDFVLLMMVNPGFAGQNMVDGMIEKLFKMKRFLIDNSYPNIEIEVDGNITFANTSILRRYGADIFVCGTGSVFNKCGTFEDNINSIRESIRRGEEE